MDVIPEFKSFRVLQLDDDGSYRCFSESEYNDKVSEWSSILSDVDRLVSIDLPRSVELVAAVSVLLQKRVPFIFHRPGSDMKDVVFYIKNTQVIRSIDEPSTSSDCDESMGVAYRITTSGTTGRPKIVDVPHPAIWPNIQDFHQRFEITAADTVLFSTSLYFDPSVVELFLPMISGASILMVPDSVRSSPHRLMDVLQKQRPTVVQLTPAVLSLCTQSDVMWLLGDRSPVRILLIGGDQFPLKLVEGCRSVPNRTRVFNVYGITEVSCWASVFEVHPGCKEVLLGDAIRGTTLEVADDGELMIGGDRGCIVDGVACGPSDLTPTGDLVERTTGGMLIVGRKDDQVKINGVRCNLNTLSGQLAASAADTVTFCRFVYYKKEFLVLFVQSSSPIDGDVISSVCPPLIHPAKIVYVDTLPVNNNGKVDLPRLTELLELEDEERHAELARYLTRKRIADDVTAWRTRSFVDYGLTSLDAAELSLLLGDSDAMWRILSPDASVESVLRAFAPRFEITNQLGPSAGLMNGDMLLPPSVEVRLVDEPQPSTSWAYNAGKCIDGSPLIIRDCAACGGATVVVVASHSGRIACIELDEGRVLWQLNLPTRFEASPSWCEAASTIVIGGYNGTVYFVDVATGGIVWQFQTQDQIKAPAAVRDDAVYIISYDRHLYRLRSTNHSLVWKAQLTFGSPAEPVLIDETTIVCTTIKGTVEAFHQLDGHRLWLVDIGSPIFSPVVCTGDNLVVTSVDGSVRRINPEGGFVIVSCCVSEPLFASVSVLDSSQIAVVTQKGSLLILEMDSLRTMRHCRLPDCSFVRAPFRLGVGPLGLVSTDGSMIVLKTDDLVPANKSSPSSIVRPSARRFRLCSAAAGFFSTPRLVRGYLLAAARDDWIRCLRFRFPDDATPSRNTE